MSGDSNLDLDAILAEFHSQEQAAAEPAPAPAPRRRRAEMAPLAQDAPAEEGTALYVSRAGRHAAPQTESVVPRRETPTAKPAAPARQPQPGQPKRADAQAQREARAAKRRKKGRLRMAIVLIALAALLAGLLGWTIRDEKKNAPEEPAPLRLELGQKLEEYLDQAATSSR